MKRIYCLLLSLIIVILSVTGCANNSPQNTESVTTASDTKTDATAENTTVSPTDTKPVETTASSKATESNSSASEPQAENTVGNIITISELCGIDKKISEETALSLVYALCNEGAEDIFEISDPSVAGEIFGLILDTKVYNRGECIDMYVMRYEDFEFNSDSESFRFSFIPNSYFCYNSLYYDIYESKPDKIRDIIEEYRISENPDYRWFTDNADIDAYFYDNGDEARSVTEIILSCYGEEISGYIEGAYDILSVDKGTDYYLITYTYGDFYSHDKQRQSRITVENGEMIIENID